MGEFNIKNYIPKNPKESALKEYAYKKFGIPLDSDDFENGFFSCFTVNDLVESMEYYIKRDGITAKVTAQNYITYIGDFYKMLADNGIFNDIFTDVAKKSLLNAKAKEVYSKLNDSEAKDIVDDEVYEKLKSGLEEYFKKLVIYDIYDEIDNFKEGKVKNIKYYNRFVSAIAIKLIIQYALSNLTTISLKFDALNITDKTLIVNGFILELTDELENLFKAYIQIREHVLKLYSTKSNSLFIKNTGEPYFKVVNGRVKSAEYGAFFFKMKDIVITQSAELFASRRILELLNRGIDISTVSKLSDKSLEKCAELQEKNQNKEEANRKLLANLIGSTEFDKKIIVNKKGYLKCPFCDREIKAVSDEWILVQFKENGSKYLACRECKGENGKIIL